MRPPHDDVTRAYIVGAWISRAAVAIALGFGLWAVVRFGPVGGFAALAGAVWIAKLAKPAMPPDLRDKFD